MASVFDRTLRSLQGERSSGSIVGIAAVGLLLAIWLAWFVSAELPVYAMSAEARLEVERAVHEVAADAAGRIIEARAQVGQEVAVGDVLFELDAQLERRRLDEETARGEALLREIESLRVALATETQGLADARAASGSATEEARSRYQAEVAAADLAEEEAKRSARLHEQGLMSEMELRRAEAQARERRAQADAQRQAVTRFDSEKLRDGRDRQVRMDQIEREIAELEGSVETSAAAARRLAEEIERRQIRSPAAGRLGEVAKVRSGSVVAAGDHLATVIPSAELKVVAGFPPSDALARVRRGQTAQMRLDGFPWTEFGSLPAEVSRVSGEARDGKLWIDCSVAPAAGSAIPLEHGMPGILVVEIERVSPAEMVLRAAGRAVTASSSAGREGSG